MPGRHRQVGHDTRYVISHFLALVGTQGLCLPARGRGGLVMCVIQLGAQLAGLGNNNNILTMQRV